VHHHARHDRVERAVDVGKAARITGDHIDPIFHAFDRRVVEWCTRDVAGLIDCAPHIDADGEPTGHAPCRLDEQQPATAPEIEHVIIRAQTCSIDDPHTLPELPHSTRRNHRQRDDREDDTHRERDPHEDRYIDQRRDEHDRECAQGDVRQVLHDARRIHPVLTARPEIGA
jgi:hypothetical protein